MESIKTLRGMLQTNVAGHPILQRKLSIYLTRLFLSTSVTPNQITVLMLLTGIVGALALALGSIWLGFFLTYLCIVLDATDGEVARYKKKYSLRGVYLDLLNHVGMESLFFFGLTLWVSDAFGTPNMPLLVTGMLGALALTFTRVNGDLPRYMYVHYAQHRKNFTLPTRSVETPVLHDDAHPSVGSVRSLKQFVYSLRYFAVMVIVLFLASLAERLWFADLAGHPLLSFAIYTYAAFFWAFLLREIFGVFFTLEHRIASLQDTFDHA